MTDENKESINNGSNQESERSHLRKLIRGKRRNLSELQQENAALQLFAHIQTLEEFHKAQKMAFYIAIDGEISPHLIVEQVHKLNKQCYLPVLDSGNHLLFVEYKPGDTLEKGQLSLSEPIVQAETTVLAQDLDIVFMPLVGFDKDGSRLGMGGGYYDRSFAFLKEPKQDKPVLIGLAHECQRVEKLQVASWDVPLKKIITDRQIYQAN